jgi:hypothetical protein
MFPHKYSPIFPPFYLIQLNPDEPTFYLPYPLNQNENNFIPYQNQNNFPPQLIEASPVNVGTQMK